MREYNRFLLLSSSPRRRQILSMVGIPFRVYSSFNIRENLTGAPEVTAVENAVLKVMAGSSLQKSDEIALAADTIVVIDGEILGKPSNRIEAAEFLSLLSGREHSVITGFALKLPEGDLIKGFEKTEVVFKPLTGEEIDWYIETGEPDDKAGAYGIQGHGAIFIEKINGDFFNVMGLPIAKIYDILLNIGIDIKKMVGR
ncbi:MULTISPECIES: Maf family protein [unclassified Desulfurobacterium]|uniref:Maf family protein n=1 Tax=Desulfurobacterium sp. TC5-1 TaxID=1158318 RepID=UPI0003B799EC|nr:Maf family protein [Desulfurobacterium sp. TC5-1]